MNHTILFREINPRIDTRYLGSKIRSEIAEQINTNDKVYLDFESFDVVTNSFENECFSK